MKREKVSLPFIGISLNGNGTWKKARLIERAVFFKEKNTVGRYVNRRRVSILFWIYTYIHKVLKRKRGGHYERHSDNQTADTGL